MIFYENKFELSLASEELPRREAMDNERGNFQKVQEKMQRSWNLGSQICLFQYYLNSSLVGIPYKELYKSLKAKKSLHIGPIAWVEEFHVGRRPVTRWRMHRFFGLGRGCGRRRAMIFSRPEPLFD